MYRADSLAMEAGVSGPGLMGNAGRGCAGAIAAHYAPGKTAILRGMGNNGGAVALLGEPGSLTGDAAGMFRPRGGTPAAFEPSVPRDCAIVVDAIFGGRPEPSGRRRPSGCTGRRRPGSGRA